MCSKLGLIGALMVMFGAPAGAATNVLTDSTLTLTIGRLPPVVVSQTGTVNIFVSSGGGSFVEPAGIFATTTTLDSLLFTGVPLISGLSVTVGNSTASVSAGGGIAGGFGGPGPLQGLALIGVGGGIVNLTIPLSVVGAGGVVSAGGAATLMVTVTGHVWTTGAAIVTGVTTVTPSGAVVNTAIIAGSDARTAGHLETLSLVTPIRILTNAAGNFPAFARQTLTFVPEPGTLVMLLGGALGLLSIGRARERD